MIIRTSLVAQMIKNLPEIQETWVHSLGGENPQALSVHFEKYCLLELPPILTVTVLKVCWQ